MRLASRLRKRRFLLAAGLIGALGLMGCSPKSDVNSAIDFVGQFHKDLSTKDYTGVDGLIDPDFREEVTKDRLDKVRSTLGELKSAQMTNYTVIYEMRAAKVRLDFESRYANGAAKEVFEIKQQAGKNTITGYRVDSPLLK